MIPYLPQPVLSLAGLRVSAFELLAAAAVVVGHAVAVRRAARSGLGARQAWRAVSWTVALGLVGSHAVAVLLQSPAQVRHDPLLLLEIWGAMSSLGGGLGGAAGALWAMRREGLDGPRRLALLDALAFAFPFALLLGRAGCALAHDHLGPPSTSFLAVAFPEGGRLDLGLLELLWALGLAATWLLLARRPRPGGTFAAAALLLYPPARLALDALRTDDARLLGPLTAGQVASLLGLAAGLWFLVRLRRRAVA